MATRLILMSVHRSLCFSPFLFFASCCFEEVLENVLFLAHESEWLSSWGCFENGEVMVNDFEMISMMKTAKGTNWPNNSQISIIFVAESSGSFAEIPPESNEKIRCSYADDHVIDFTHHKGCTWPSWLWELPWSRLQNDRCQWRVCSLQQWPYKRLEWTPKWNKFRSGGTVSEQLGLQFHCHETLTSWKLQSVWGSWFLHSESWRFQGPIRCHPKGLKGRLTVM